MIGLVKGPMIKNIKVADYLQNTTKVKLESGFIWCFTALDYESFEKIWHI